MILIIAIVLLLFFYIIEPKIMKQKIKNDNEYGSARFSTFEEINKNFIKESVSDIKEAGFPIWYSKDNKYVWFDKQTPHYIYLGSTGSGKSVTAVIPTCSFIATAKKKRSVFITDPKGEIYHTTSSMFKKNGYEIYTIDFRNPEKSNNINLLQPIINEYDKYIEYDDISTECEKDIKRINCNIDNLNEEISLLNEINQINYKKGTLDKELLDLEELKERLVDNRNKSMKHLAETNRLITSLADMIMTDKSAEKDPFWNNSASNLLEGLIGLFLEEYKKGKITREKITLTSINKFQNSSMEESNFEILKDYIERKPYGLKSKDRLTSIFSASENTYKSITAVFGEKMSLFDDVNVANITSSSDFDFDILGKKPTAIYIIVPDEDKTYYSLITIIVGLLYRELVKLANEKEDKRLPVQIDWILDEFANCPPLNDIEAIVSVARSRGMRFQFFIQSFSQLDNVYGKDVAQIILDNCGLVYLKTNTQDTAEAISKRLGKKTIESNSLSQSISKLDYNGNRSVGLMGRDLLTPEEVKQLHFKTIIFPTVGFPIFRDTVLYNKFSCYSKGEEERKTKILKDLSYTYFTVEHLNTKLKKQRTNIEENKEDIKDFFEDYKLMYDDILNEIKNILSNQEFNIEFPIENNILYCSIKLNYYLCGDDIDKITSLSTDLFHYEIKKENENQIINIHRKNVFS